MSPAEKAFLQRMANLINEVIRHRHRQCMGEVSFNTEIKNPDARVLDAWLRGAADVELELDRLRRERNAQASSKSAEMCR